MNTVQDIIDHAICCLDSDTLEFSVPTMDNYSKVVHDVYVGTDGLVRMLSVNDKEITFIIEEYDVYGL